MRTFAMISVVSIAFLWGALIGLQRQTLELSQDVRRLTGLLEKSIDRQLETEKVVNALVRNQPGSTTVPTDHTITVKEINGIPSFNHTNNSVK